MLCPPYGHFSFQKISNVVSVSFNEWMKGRTTFVWTILANWNCFNLSSVKLLSMLVTWAIMNVNSIKNFVWVKNGRSQAVNKHLSMPILWKPNHTHLECVFGGYCTCLPIFLSVALEHGNQTLPEHSQYMELHVPRFSQVLAVCQQQTPTINFWKLGFLLEKAVVFVNSSDGRCYY